MVAERVRPSPILFVTALVCLALFPPVGGEHEPAHRYYIVGTVTNDRGEALCNVVVRAQDLDVPDSPDTNRVGTTDLLGRYEIRLHIHDETVSPDHNVGDAIRVSVEGTSASRVVLAVSNSNNLDGWGQQTVDLSVPGQESTCESASRVPYLGFPSWALFAILAVVVPIIVVAVLARDARRHREASGAEAPGIRPPG